MILNSLICLFSVLNHQELDSSHHPETLFALTQDYSKVYPILYVIDFEEPGSL
jgi:hypothetical protein